MKKYKEDIGVIGFGRFGRLFVRILADDFPVLVYDINKNEDIIKEAKDIGVKLASLSEVASCKNVIFCVPILHFSEALNTSIQYFSEGTTVIDVLSVKEYPLKLMNSIVPANINILPTHPIFGPNMYEDNNKSIKGFSMVICPEQTPPNITSSWRSYFESKELRVVEMSCEQHDRITARSLCVTQLLGRILDKIDIKSSEIDTPDFKSLLEVRRIAMNDTLELFQGLQQKNPYSDEMREDLMKALKVIEIDLKNSSLTQFDHDGYKGG